MDQIKLKYFISAAANLSFTKAAEECHVVQGTISKQIAAIENELNVKLFIRKGQVLELTPAGQKLYNDSSEYLEQYEAIESSLMKLHLLNEGKLRIAIGTMEHPLAIAPLAHFYERYPKNEVFVSTYTYSRMISHFKAGTVDIGFCPDICLSFLPDIKHIDIYSGDLCVAASEDSHFWHMSLYDQSILKNQNIISVFGNQFDCVYKHCSENKFEYKSFDFTNALVSLLSIVRSGGGIAILPPFLYNKIDGIRMENILKYPLKMGFSLLYRNDSSKTVTINKFLEFFS